MVGELQWFDLSCVVLEEEGSDVVRRPLTGHLKVEEDELGEVGWAGVLRGAHFCVPGIVREVAVDVGEWPAAMFPAAMPRCAMPC